MTLTNLEVTESPLSISHNGDSLFEIGYTGAEKLGAILTDSDGNTQVEFDASFSVALKFNFVKLEGIINDLPSDLLSETATVDFGGDAPGFTGLEEKLRVDSGENTLSSSAQDKTITATAGQCLLEQETADDASWIDGFQVGSCD